MMKTFAVFAFLTSAAWAQYKMEPVSSPPEGLDPGFAALIDAKGYKIANAAGAVVGEVWFRKTAPSGPSTPEDAVAFPTIPHGALLGVLRLPVPGSDRRGQSLKPGLYTLRYSRYPADGNHQGVAPIRDFLILAPASADKDANATPAFDVLMDLGRKASGTPHPACLEMSTPEAGATFPSLVRHGEKDWAIDVKLGALPVGVILIGKAEG